MVEIKRRIILRYALFQVPSVILLIFILILVQQWIDLPSWLYGCIAGLWIVKDVLMFPFVWRAYDRDRSKELQLLIGSEGIVEERLAPTGHIWVHGELWQAEVAGTALPIEKGEVVRIQGIRGLKLVVEAQK